MHEIIGEYMGTIAIVAISGTLITTLAFVLRYLIVLL
jgi:hypothetical protein